MTQEEYRYTTDQWKKALKAVGVSEEQFLKAAIILINEDIARSQRKLKTFKSRK